MSLPPDSLGGEPSGGGGDDEGGMVGCPTIPMRLVPS